MNTIKKYAWPTIIILAASIIVALAILPLANTEFGDGIRIGSNHPFSLDLAGLIDNTHGRLPQ